MRRFGTLRLGVKPRLVVVLGLTVLLVSAVARAEEKAASAGGTGAAAESELAAGAAPKCKAMQEASTAATVHLNDKLAAVDAASGDAKVAAMSDLLHELVAQHGSIRCGAEGCCPSDCCELAKQHGKGAMEKCEMMRGHEGHGSKSGKGSGHDAHH